MIYSYTINIAIDKQYLTISNQSYNKDITHICFEAPQRATQRGPWQLPGDRLGWCW